MANNYALVTKLKESVDNNKLPMLNELSLYVNSSSPINTSIAKTRNESVELRVGTGVTVSGTRYPIFSGEGYVFVKNKPSIIELITASNNNSPYVILSYSDLKYCTSLNRMAVYNNNVEGLNTLEKLDVLPLTYLKIDSYSINGDIVNLQSLTNSLTELSIKNITGLQLTLTKLALFKVLGTLEWDSTVFSGALEDFVAKRATFGNDYKTGSLTIKYPHYNENVTFCGEALDPITTGTLQWSPTGDNISISFNGHSTVIHVNSDGTWSEV